MSISLSTHQRKNAGVFLASFAAPSTCDYRSQDGLSTHSATATIAIPVSRKSHIYLGEIYPTVDYDVTSHPTTLSVPSTSIELITATGFTSTWSNATTTDGVDFHPYQHLQQENH